jgi:hypothetical protein
LRGECFNLDIVSRLGLSDKGYTYLKLYFASRHFFWAAVIDREWGPCYLQAFLHHPFHQFTYESPHIVAYRSNCAFVENARCSHFVYHFQFWLNHHYPLNSCSQQMKNFVILNPFAGESHVLLYIQNAI